MGKRASILFRRTLSREERSSLRTFAEELSAQVAGGGEFVCLMTNDTQLHKLNFEFLGHDYPTDVLSFPSGEPGSLGELAISVDRAAEQAVAHGHTLLEELKILMLHGLLHLLGMDHETDRGQMRRTETKWRKHFGLPGGLIERSRR